MGLGLLSCSQLIGVEPQGTAGPSSSWGHHWLPGVSSPGRKQLGKIRKREEES